MLDYHTDLIIKIDYAILGAYLAFAVVLILFVIARDRHARKRVKKLLNIKNNISKLFLSGDNSKLLTPLITKAAPVDFLDIETNRQKFLVFFNESEQELFREHFVTPERIKKLQATAGGRGNKWRRIEAIMALGYAKADSSLDILEKALRDKNEDISYFTALAIGQISTMSSVSILMRFLKERPLLRRKIASILETLTPDITDEVIKFADDPDEEVRVWAVRLLAKSVSKEYVNKVRELVMDPSSDVRAAACESIMRLNDKDSKEILVKRLKDDVWFVRMHAVRALSGLFGKESIPEVIKLLNDGSLSVLDSVRKVLTDNIESAIAYMPRIFDGSDELSKKLCVEAIESSDYTIHILRDALSDDKDRRNFANRILRAMVDTNAHLGLEAALKWMGEDDVRRLLEIVRKHDAPIALHIEKILNNELNEL